MRKIYISIALCRFNECVALARWTTYRVVRCVGTVENRTVGRCARAVDDRSCWSLRWRGGRQDVFVVDSLRWHSGRQNVSVVASHNTTLPVATRGYLRSGGIRSIVFNKNETPLYQLFPVIFGLTHLGGHFAVADAPWAEKREKEK